MVVHVPWPLHSGLLTDDKAELSATCAISTAVSERLKVFGAMEMTLTMHYLYPGSLGFLGNSNVAPWFGSFLRATRCHYKGPVYDVST